MDGYGLQSTIAAPAPGRGQANADETAARAVTRQSTAHRVLLWAAVISGALTHGWHLFMYPLAITDEGIYMEQAWSVLREGRLSPYTYFYDHAPAG